jgi:cysteine desulfurase
MTGSAAAATIYLDHAATTPLRDEVREAIATAETAGFANPSSPHALGRQARRLLDDARERILALLGARTTGRDRDRLVFTSGATEANRLALLGMAGTGPVACRHSPRDHGSVVAAARQLSDRGCDVASVPLLASARLDCGRLAWPATNARRILCTTLVCGQTGSLEDLAAVRAAGSDCRIHMDATQAVAVEPVSFAALGVHTLAFAPHKFGGPRGIGCLIIRGDTELAAVTPGPQEAGIRGGTEAVPLAVGCATAVDLAVAVRAAETRRLRELRDRLEAGLAAVAAAAGRSAIVIAAESPRAAHIATVAFPGIDRQAFVMAADLECVCCATGTACASGSSLPAPALEALGLPPDLAATAVRFSLGWTTTVADVDEALARVSRILRCRQGSCGPVTP